MIIKHRQTKMLSKYLLAPLMLAMGLTMFQSVRAADSYQFGVLFPLTGPNATYGDVFSKGVDLAVKMVNKSGELDHPIEANYVDSQALPQHAVVGMNKLVHVDEVPYVLTAFSGVSKAIAPIGNRFHVIMVNGGGVSPELAIGDYFLNVIPLADQETKALLPYVVKKHNLERLAVIHVNDPFGNSVRDAVNTVCGDLSCEVVSDLSVNPDTSSFQAEVAKIRAAKPDAVFVASYGQQQNVMVKQLRDGGVDAQILSYSGFGIPTTLALKEAQGAIFDNQQLALDVNDLSKEFRKRYLEDNSDDPNFFVANYANAVFIYAELIDRLEKQSRDVTGENLLDTLHSGLGFDIIGGEMTFNDDGTVTIPIAINMIEDGKAIPQTVVNP